MIKILAVETSTEACSVALLIENPGSSCEPVLIQRFELAPQKHAEKILPMIVSVLTEAHLSLAQMSGIAFGCGPGSFMGVRIATSVAQALAFAANLPVIPVSTLQALAQGAYEHTHVEWILPAWDARMQEAYWGAYRVGEENIVEAVMADTLSTPEKMHMESSTRSWLAVGNAWEIYHPLRYPLLRDQYPQAYAVAKIALKYYQQGRVVSYSAAQPCYLRNQQFAPASGRSLLP